MNWKKVSSTIITQKKLIPEYVKYVFNFSKTIRKTNNPKEKIQAKALYRHATAKDTQVADKHMKRCSI